MHNADEVPNIEIWILEFQVRMNEILVIGWCFGYFICILINKQLQIIGIWDFRCWSRGVCKKGKGKLAGRLRKYGAGIYTLQASAHALTKRLYFNFNGHTVLSVNTLGYTITGCHYREQNSSTATSEVVYTVISYVYTISL